MPAGEVAFIVLIAFFIAAQEAISISLLVRAPAAENREESGRAMLVKMGPLRVIALPALRILRARVQAILVAALVSVRAITIAAIIRGLVNARVVIGAIAIISIPIPPMLVLAVMIAISVMIPIMVVVVISAVMMSPSR